MERIASSCGFWYPRDGCALLATGFLAFCGILHETALGFHFDYTVTMAQQFFSVTVGLILLARLPPSYVS